MHYLNSLAIPVTTELLGQVKSSKELKVLAKPSHSSCPATDFAVIMHSVKTIFHFISAAPKPLAAAGVE